MKNQSTQTIEAIKNDLEKIQKSIKKKRNSKEPFFGAYAFTLNRLDSGVEAIQESLKNATEGPHEKVTPTAENIKRKRSS